MRPGGEEIGSRGKRPPLPGKKRSTRRIEEMIRVDHAGEYGAVTIYKAQAAVFRPLPHKAGMANQMQRMQDDEQAHLDAFDDLVLTTPARPTALAPLWELGGTLLGFATAMMGERAAHACTEAVEKVIEGHYASQIEELEIMGETELAARFTQFREEEIAHKDFAVSEGAHEAAGYPLLAALIEGGCRTAIAASERV